MEKQWVKLRLSLSSLLLYSAVVFAGAEPPEQLSQNDLHNPVVVKQWLEKNAARADKQVAGEFFKIGMNYMQKGNWSAATKSFGESALFFPAPTTLRLRAEAELKMLGMIRARKTGPNEKQNSDLAYGVSMYKTSLAADDVLHQLKSDERKSIEKNIQCMTEFLKNPYVETSCEAVRAYLSAK